MRTWTLVIVCTVFFAPTFSFAKDEPLPEPTIGSPDICLNETVVIDPDATPMIRNVPGTRVPSAQCHCTVTQTEDGPMYSGVGVVSFESSDGQTTKTISKCDPRGEDIRAALASDDPVGELAREETRSILEHVVLSSGTLPDAYLEAFNEAGIDTEEIVATHSREDAARILSNLAFGSDAARTEAARIAGITQAQLNQLAANAVRLTPTRFEEAARVFNDNLTTSERTQYFNVLSTFAAPQTLARADVNPNARRPTQTEAAAAAQLAYNDVLALGYSPQDLVRGSGQTVQEMTLAQAAAVEAYRNRLNEMGVLHPELDRALTFAVIRREGDILGQPGDMVSTTGVRGPLQVTRDSAITSFGNATGFTLESGTIVSAADFARTDPLGSYISGMAELNNRLFIYAPVTNGTYEEQGVINALQAYNSGSPGSCIGGDCNYGVKAYHDVQVMREAVANGNGDITTIAQSLGSLYGDRSRGADERTIWAMALAAEPLDGTFLPPADYTQVPFNSFIARVTVPAVGGIASPLSVTNFGTRVVEQVWDADTATTTDSIGTIIGSLIGRFMSQGNGGGIAIGENENGNPLPFRALGESTNANGSVSVDGTLLGSLGEGGAGATLNGPNAVAVIIAQPQETTRGKSVIVSWSSVGMSQTATCHVLMRVASSTELIAQGNEGSRSVSFSATSTPGVRDFVLQCTAASTESLVEEKVSVTLR